MPNPTDTTLALEKTAATTGVIRNALRVAPRVFEKVGFVSEELAEMPVVKAAGPLAMAVTATSGIIKAHNQIEEGDTRAASETLGKTTGIVGCGYTGGEAGLFAGGPWGALIGGVGGAAACSPAGKYIGGKLYDGISYLFNRAVVQPSSNWVNNQVAGYYRTAQLDARLYAEDARKSTRSEGIPSVAPSASVTAEIQKLAFVTTPQTMTQVTAVKTGLQSLNLYGGTMDARWTMELTGSFKALMDNVQETDVYHATGAPKDSLYGRNVQKVFDYWIESGLLNPAEVEMVHAIKALDKSGSLNRLYSPGLVETPAQHNTQTVENPKMEETAAGMVSPELADSQNQQPNPVVTSASIRPNF